jgi:hypothetical protein
MCRPPTRGAVRHRDSSIQPATRRRACSRVANCWSRSSSNSSVELNDSAAALSRAELVGIPVEQVGAAFYYVRSGDVIRHNNLPGRDELIALLNG